MMSERDITGWRLLRSHGKRRYVLLQGIALYGVLTFILYIFGMNIAYNIIEGRSLLSTVWLSELGVTSYLIFFVFLTIVGGAIAGHFMWRYNERKYLKATGDDDAAHSV